MSSSSPVVEPSRTSTKLTRHTPARSTKDKYETMEKLQAWMTDKVYGIGGTKDKVSRRSRSCCQPRPSDPLASPGHCSKGPRASHVVAQTLKIRGNPKVFIEIPPPTSRTATPPATSLLPYCLTT